MEINPKYSIIIPFFNRWDLTHARLYELHRYAPKNCEVILINDASTELDAEGGISWWQEDVVTSFKIRYKKNKENLGFGGSMNLGARYAKGDILIFLSNDVKVSGDFISQIGIILGNNPKYFIGGEVISFPGGWNEFDIDGKHITIPYANGWLIACTNECWKDLGGFDLRYGKFDYEDVDISTTAILKGYDIIPLNSQYVKHEHQGSTISNLNVDRLSQTKRNREIYIEKWQKKLANLGE